MKTITILQPAVISTSMSQQLTVLSDPYIFMTIWIRSKFSSSIMHTKSAFRSLLCKFCMFFTCHNAVLHTQAQLAEQDSFNSEFSCLRWKNWYSQVSLETLQSWGGIDSAFYFNCVTANFGPKGNLQNQCRPNTIYSLGLSGISFWWRPAIRTEVVTAVTVGI